MLNHLHDQIDWFLVWEKTDEAKIKYNFEGKMKGLVLSGSFIDGVLEGY